MAKSEIKQPESGLGATIDIDEVMRRIPHRYPFLLVDRAYDYVPHTSIRGIKGVTINEPFFQGHFPQRPVMPGVLIIEAMAQTAAVLVVETLGPEAEGKLVYFMTIEEARFRKPVVPGDRVMIHCRKERNRGPVWKFSAQAKVDGTLCAEATYSAMILER
jgi:3-hydroxyacyl-[acyl-carrier-protein] dehydratase